MSKKDIAIFHLNIGISLVIQCFTGGIQKYIGSMKKVVLGEGYAGRGLKNPPQIQNGKII